MSLPTDRCAFGSWCPKRSHARLWCGAQAVGSVVRHDGASQRSCAEHGPTFASWESAYNAEWIPDGQRITQPELTLAL